MRSVVVLVVLCLVGAFAEELPVWALRDHYSFEGDAAAFRFDVQRAIWKLDVTGLGDVVGDVQAEIVLGDGRAIAIPDLVFEKDGREKFDGPMGAGSMFSSTFKPKDGLAVRCAIARFEKQPFLVLYLDAKNAGTTPLEIAAIRPAVVGVGGIRASSGTMTVTRLASDQRGDRVGVQDGEGAGLFQIQLSSPPVILALGVLQSGRADSRINFVPAGAKWQGNIECKFNPPVTLAPGEEISCDPLWISFGTPEPERVNEFFSWAQSVYPESPFKRTFPPEAWVSVKSGDSADDLVQAARAWKGSGVKHALIPAGFVDRDPKGIAQRLATEGMAPGLTVDPLADGGKWLNPSNRQDRATALENMRKFAQPPFKFFAVEPSLIPDKELRQFKLTRREADSAAFRIMVEAADELPVVASPSISLGDEVLRWRLATAAAKILGRYTNGIAPVRFEVSKANELTPELISLITSFNGPVELVGEPKANLRGEIAKAVAAQPGAD